MTGKETHSEQVAVAAQRKDPLCMCDRKKKMVWREAEEMDEEGGGEDG